MIGWYIAVVLMGVTLVMLSVAQIRNEKTLHRLLTINKTIFATIDQMTEHNKVRDALIVTLWRAAGLTGEELPGDN